MNSPRALMRACWIVPVIFGIYSIAQGADSNWDLRNYHLYNAYAFLHGRLSIDLAPAGMQSYFNPLLDVPYYAMAMHLPALLVGFIMGVLHGLNFVLLLGICRLTLTGLPESARYRTPFWLALAGCLTANFLSAIGNSMGDNTTSLITLGAVLIVLKSWPRLAQADVRVHTALFLAGLMSGAGAGLKLTTVVYSVALCGGLLFAPLTVAARLRCAFVFGLGVLAGLAATGGFWFVELWHRYGNPLYPQFSSVFPSPLTSPVSIVDTQWLPKSVWEALVYPFVFSINPRRVGQARLHQVIWAVAYVCFWSWVVFCALKASRRAERAPLPARGRYVIAYVAIGFVTWMKIFSIQRYLVAVEVCLPLVIYLLLTQRLAYERAVRISKRILVACSILVVAGGAHSWGHDAWARKMFAIDLPPLETPDTTTVLLTAGDPPLGWMVPLFPQSLAFATIQSAFPQARPAFDDKVHEMARSRGGPVYALIPGYWDKDKYDAARNARELSAAGTVLADYAFSLDAASCVLYKAHIGAGTYPYQWCRVASTRNGALRPGH
ncbi:hypothetical protein [Caballeronia sp. RCC_10]|uniref:hypothetical protein n=1 Tax=Caballeronia sp. RCC_10 TaxID=3239227 RepID=UPI0035252925